MKDGMTARDFAIEVGYSEETAGRYYSHLISGKLDEEDKKIMAKLDDYLLQKAQSDLSIVAEKRKNGTVF